MPTATEPDTAAAVPGYQVNDTIFEGDPTRVYRARRESDGLPVMLKVLHHERQAREAAARFRHEYDMTRRVNVYTVVRAHALEQSRGLPVIVLEDFGGDSLDKVAKEKPLGLEELLRVSIHVVEGLAGIHAAGIIHKDINPSNIVYNRASGETKIIDFGISTSLTREQTAVASPEVLEGSLPYVSPEQTGRMNRALDYRSDFYSLGATLYELLTHRPLFLVAEPLEWMHAHIARQPKAPVEVDPAIPQVLSDIVMKLLAKTAEERYQSAKGIKVDLEACLERLRADGSIEPFPIGERDRAERFQIPQRLYGREQQVEELLASFQRVSGGTMELVLLSGQSGIGKTCLAKEVYKPITERRGYFIAGKFDQLHRNVPYSALITALRDLIRQLLTENEDQLQRWRCELLAALGPNGQMIVDLIGELEVIIGPQPPLPVLPPQATEQLFNWVFQNFIRVFCQPHHPLVVFLDDLQWADAASFRLLRLLASGEHMGSLLVIGAYRDNEVGAGHPLTFALHEIREQGGQIQEIALAPLDLDQLSRLIGDTLYRDPGEVRELAELVLEKTGGNPFFTEEFLKHLHAEGFIRCDSVNGKWSWDSAAIKAEQMTDNVVELMAGKLQRLPPRTQNLVQLAACIGNRFQLSALAFVSEATPAEVAQHLEPAVAEGLIAPIGSAYQLAELAQGSPERDGELTVEFAFAHDRIQQAANSLLDDADKRTAHVSIGRLLLDRLSEQQQEAKLFDITNHLNLGSELIVTPQEQLTLCRLNLRAGQRAKSSSAYATALDYLYKGLALLPRDSWDSEYELSYSLVLEAAQSASLGGDYPEMDRLLEQALSATAKSLDRARLYEIRIGAFLACNQMQEAIALSLRVLRKLGVTIPPKPNRWHRRIAAAIAHWRIRGKTMSDLATMPVATGQRRQTVERIGRQLGAAAFLTRPELYPLLVYGGVAEAAIRGHTVHTLPVYATYGILLCALDGKLERGYQFGQLAMDLGTQMDAPTVQVNLRVLYSGFIQHWREPLRNTLEPLLENFQHARDLGDFENANHSVNMYGYNAFFAGMDLEQFAEEMAAHRQAITELKQKALLHYTEALRQVALNLMGESDDPCRLVGDSYDETRLLPEHEATGDKSISLYVYIMKMELCYFFGDYEQALRHAEKVEYYLDSAHGGFAVIVSNFYGSLIRLAVARSAKGARLRALLRRVRRDQTQLRHWATHCPANCLHKHNLIEAERLRLRGRVFRAHELYDQAIKHAREHGFIQEAAVASELAAGMHLDAGRDTIAEAYLLKAHDTYSLWGAQAKVAELEGRHPQLREMARPRRRSRTTQDVTTQDTTTSLGDVEITSLIKALKAIADEPVHSRMVETITTTALAFAGAQHGVLILRNHQGGFCIEAEATVDGKRPQILQSRPLEQGQISQAVVNYVTRTMTSIVVHDAQKPSGDVPGLNLDDYIRDNGVRSILCLPIIANASDAAELIGVLYLENNRASNTFTEERFSTLEIICMAAAGRLELSRKAAIDGLTQLYNHDYFQNILRQEWAAAARNKSTLTVILCDIDHFKQFNDTWGHQVGDLVLKEVASLIKQSCRESDTVARYGGEEMVVVLPGTDAEAGTVVAERIREKVEQAIIPHGDHRLHVTLSLGVATTMADSGSREGLIRQADSALYLSKDHGRNRVTTA